MRSSSKTSLRMYIKPTQHTPTTHIDNPHRIRLHNIIDIQLPISGPRKNIRILSIKLTLNRVIPHIVPPILRNLSPRAPVHQAHQSLEHRHHVRSATRSHAHRLDSLRELVAYKLAHPDVVEASSSVHRAAD